jgi:hypothetical protein
MSLLDDVSLMITPNGVTEDVLFGVLPQPIIGVELITNGDFATDSDWDKLNGSTISGGVGNVVANGNLSTTGANWGLTQDNVFTPSTPYMIKFRARQTSGSGNFEVAYSYGYILKKVITSSFVDYCIYFTTNSSGWNDLSFGGSTIGDTFEVDNVSVKEYTSADMDFTRATTATKVNSAGLVASVAIGIPRLDFTGGGCPHILSEPQRINIALRSQEIDNATWVKTNGGTGSAPVVTANDIVSPDGDQNAEKVVFDLNGGTSGSDYSYLSQTYTQTADTYSLSCYLKGASGGEKIFLDFDSANSNIVTLTTDWVRYTFTKAVTNTGSKTLRVGTRGSVATDDNPTIYMWGCQLEVGSYATSYIPTSGSTVTRNEDTFTRTGIADLINSAEGVLYVEIAALDDDQTSRKISLNDGTTNNSVLIGYTSVSNEIKTKVNSGGSSTANMNFTATDILSYIKIAIKWKVNDFAMWVNGVEVVTDNSGAAPIGLTELSFDRGDGAENFRGKVRNLQVYKTALSDSQLTSLTT